MQKKNLPGRLTTTVSGHVESGMTYLEAAVKEITEEAGVTVDGNDLIDLGPIYYNSSNGMRWAGRFLYCYKGTIDELQIEEGEGDGFELMSIPALRTMINSTPEKLTPFVTGEASAHMLDDIETRPSTQ